MPMFASIAIAMIGVMPVSQCGDVLSVDQTRLQFADGQLGALGNPREVEHCRRDFFARDAPVTVRNGYKFRDRRDVGHTPNATTDIGRRTSAIGQKTDIGHRTSGIGENSVGKSRNEKGHRLGRPFFKLESLRERQLVPCGEITIVQIQGSSKIV